MHLSRRITTRDESADSDRVKERALNDATRRARVARGRVALAADRNDTPVSSAKPPVPASAWRARALEDLEARRPHDALRASVMDVATIPSPRFQCAYTNGCARHTRDR